MLSFLFKIKFLLVIFLYFRYVKAIGDSQDKPSLILYS
ncbi:hypothetical protein CSC14_3065 [Proteus mirabilis]|nr:hypothetical protein BB2000_2045 [Proteus mirabilis BB2000]AWF42131.1 hypothetical protein CSC16_0501 [Proteus mirabilis]PVF83624.1 hypothetical protein CSC14_3065 [Proteus mirabilis]